MSDDDNIIQFSLARRQEGNRLERKTWIGRRCRHEAVEICGATRAVTCATCEAVLDPVTVLLEFADKERQFGFNKLEVSNLDKRCEQLRVEEKKLRARIKATKKRDVDEAVAAAGKRMDDQRQRSIANANEAIELMRKIVRANGGQTAEQRAWAREGRARKAGPTRVFGGDQ